MEIQQMYTPANKSTKLISMLTVSAVCSTAGATSIAAAVTPHTIPEAFSWVCALAGVLAWAIVYFAARPRPSETGDESHAPANPSRGVVTGILLGGLMGAGWTTLMFATPQSMPVVALVVAALVGFPLGAGVGIALTLLELPLIIAVSRLAPPRSVEAGDIMCLWAGLWLLAVAGASTIAIVVTTPSPFFSQSLPSTAFAISAAATSAGLAIASYGLVGRSRRRRWLSRVRQGMVPGWAIVGREEVDESKAGALVPFFHPGFGEDYGGVLVQLHKSGGKGGYRSAKTAQPWAEVPLDSSAS